MKRHFPIFFMILLIMAAAACVQEPLPTQPPASAEPYHPLTAETGVKSIDQVLAAVASGNPESLRAVIEFFEAECTQREGLGGPPKCREGEAEGTPVEVLAFLGSEGGHLRRDEIDNWPGIVASGIYAVYEVNAAAVSSEQYYPVGKYVILLVSEEAHSATALRVGERGIVRIDAIFDVSPANLNAMLEREAANVLLAPKP